MYNNKLNREIQEKIFKEYIHPGGRLQGFQARKIAFNLGLSGEAFKNCVKFVTNLYNAYVDLDCGMLEINPLFKTSDIAKSFGYIDQIGNRNKRKFNI